MNFSEFQNKAQGFLDEIARRMRAQRVDLLPHWSVDHLCYRTSSLEQYEFVKDATQSFADLLIESPVNGRPIATYKLKEPVLFGEHEIHLVEVPAPKPSRVTPDGFEHIEIVCDETFMALEERFADADFDHGGVDKNLNRELQLNLPGAPALAVKFHHLSLESVVRFERQERVFKTVQATDVLHKLKTYDPLIAGTFPLDLNVESSDVDIVLTVSNLEKWREEMQTLFAREKGFFLDLKEKQGAPVGVMRFERDGLPFEIFASAVPSLQQRAYRHFLIEERLLKLGGERFFNSVKELRARGMKTEPAFAQLLKLPGDPYEALLALHPYSELQLKEILKESYVTGAT